MSAEMFALIWWIHSKKSSVIPYNEINFSAKKKLRFYRKRNFTLLKF